MSRNDHWYVTRWGYLACLLEPARKTAGKPATQNPVFLSALLSLPARHHIICILVREDYDNRRPESIFCKSGLGQGF